MTKKEMMKVAKENNLKVNAKMTASELENLLKENNLMKKEVEEQKAEEQKAEEQKAEEQKAEEQKAEEKEASLFEDAKRADEELFFILYKVYRDKIMHDNVEVRVMKDKSLSINLEIRDASVDEASKSNRLFCYFRVYRSASNKYRLTTTVKKAVRNLDNVETVVKKSSKQTYYKVCNMSKEEFEKQLAKIEF